MINNDYHNNEMYEISIKYKPHNICRGLFCVIWYVGLPPAVMGWVASCGDGP